MNRHETCARVHTQTDTQTYVDKRYAIALIARGDGPSDCGAEREIQEKGRTAATAARVQRQRRTHRQRKSRCPVVAVVVVLRIVHKMSGENA